MTRRGATANPGDWPTTPLLVGLPARKIATAVGGMLGIAIGAVLVGRWHR